MGDERGGFLHAGYATLAVNASNGSQNWVERTPVQADGGRVATTAIGVSPDGSRVFVTGISGTVAYDAVTGAQVWLDHYKIRWDRYPGYLAVSPDSSTVFVTNTASGGDPSHFVTTALNAATGATIWTARYGSGGFSAITVSPDGSAVFVTGRGPQGFETIAYKASTGARLWAVSASGGGGATSIAVSPDGSKLLVTGAAPAPGNTSEYQTIAYDAGTGTELWTAFYQGPAGASSSPVSLGAAPDGSRVYVTGTSSLTSGQTEYATVAYRS